MSSGAFTLTKYEANDASIHPIRLQPETLTPFDNVAPTGATTSSISAVVSLTRRQKGLRPRYLSVKLTAAKDGYKADTIYRIPILKATVWAGVNVGDTGTYLGTACVVVGKEDERSR